jgi:hypothetical protein
MLFTFKRDEEGVERIYHNGVRFAILGAHEYDGSLICTLCATPPHGVNENHIDDAIERADEAGFWEVRKMSEFDDEWISGEVTVDVPVADNATLSVTTEDES